MKRSEWANTWLQQGKHDLEAAYALRKDGFWDTCALMCQQAAEKSVKALWIDAKKQDPPKIHAVGRMALELGAAKELVQSINILVGDYMASRYPDMAVGSAYGQYTVDDANDRLDKAEQVIKWVEHSWEGNDGN